LLAGILQVNDYGANEEPDVVLVWLKLNMRRLRY
jgi:hypothetical protein